MRERVVWWKPEENKKKEKFYFVRFACGEDHQQNKQCGFPDKVGNCPE